MSAPPYRQKALARYGERCVVCGTTEDIEVHHIDRDRQNDDDDNLAPLCQTHHHQLHNSGAPYTVFFALPTPIIELLDAMRNRRGHASRSETVGRALVAMSDIHDANDTTREAARSAATSAYWSTPSATDEDEDEDDDEDEDEDDDEAASCDPGATIRDMAEAVEDSPHDTGLWAEGESYPRHYKRTSAYETDSDDDDREEDPV